ncbi:MAG: exodeoxyribonuclease III [Alphaproteobacteria bacterium]|nr:exodeoxyribonuclease III [Alphaproteobacteria bacterium]
MQKEEVGPAEKKDGKDIKIATWNINSIRKRLALVNRFVREETPDVLCLQEIKCENKEFPEEALRRMGYPYIAVNGQKGYHGVAIVSRLPFTQIGSQRFCNKDDARHLQVVFGCEAGKLSDITLHNVYVPAGGDDPDPVSNPKFAHKLAFLKEMQERIKGATILEDKTLSLLMGDLNVAPLETDVWSHRQLINVVSHTPIECAYLNNIMAEGWVDVARVHIPPKQKLYTWWSYRAKNWELSDRGRRLDHIWASPHLAGSISAIKLIKHARGWESPSDHIPLIATLTRGDRQTPRSL